MSSASVFLRGLMGTSMSALATETRGIPRASPNALENGCFRNLCMNEQREREVEECVEIGAVHNKE